MTLNDWKREQIDSIAYQSKMCGRAVETTYETSYIRALYDHFSGVPRSSYRIVYLLFHRLFGITHATIHSAYDLALTVSVSTVEHHATVDFRNRGKQW